MAVRPGPSGAGLAVVVALLLAGPACAPGHLLIDEAEPERIEHRLEAIEQRLEAQAQERDAAAQARREAELSRIAGAMEAQLDQHWLTPTWLRVAAEVERPEPDHPADERLREGEAVSGEGMHVLGEIERVQLDPPGLTFDARVDTGATTSSLDARAIETFERDGEPWVRFEIVVPEDQLEADGPTRLAVERPKVREAVILQAAGEERRPVVELHLAVGGLSEVAEFTLRDREHLTHPVLIGRNVLRDVAVVDVGLERATDPVEPDEEDLDALEARDYVEELTEDDEDGDEADDPEEPDDEEEADGGAEADG